MINNKKIYFKRETKTLSKIYFTKRNVEWYCILLDKSMIVTIVKPFDAGCKHMYYVVFRQSQNFKYFIPLFLIPIILIKVMFKKCRCLIIFSGEWKTFLQKVPFRITVITLTGKHTFTAVNYLYNRTAEVETYRVWSNDTNNYGLIYVTICFRSFAMSISIKSLYKLVMKIF